MNAGSEITDEMLMAFADGELDGEDAARVERAIEASPEVEARLAMFMATRQQASGAFSGMLASPVPERLIAAAMGGAGIARSQPAAAAPSAEGAVIRPFERPAAARMSTRWAPLALAASIAAVAAGLLGYISGRPGTSAPSAMAALFSDSAAVGAALASLGDGESRLLPATSLTASATGTYRLADQRICRTLDASHAPSGTAAQALACRSEGGWRIEAALPKLPDDGRFRPAGGAIGIDALLEAGGAGQALGREETMRLIREGWR